MKKLLSVIAFALCFAIVNPVSAYAYEVPTAGEVGTVGAATVMGLDNAYETSVVARMRHRAGASTVGGAKGISFEILYSDMKNMFHNLKGGLKTKLSVSSIDDVADLVTTNKNGEVIQLIQCKDGTSPAQISKAIQQVSSGKYASAELVGTTEFATLYNKEAVEQGLSQMATDSGISTGRTGKIANKALGIAPTRSQLLKSTLKNSGLAAAVVGCISMAESIYRGEDIYTATGSMVEDASVSAVTVALATVTSAELPAFLSSIGASAVVANTAATVVAIIVPVAGGYALYMLADECQLEEKVADAAEDVAIAVSNTYHRVSEEITGDNLKEKAIETWSSVSATVGNLTSTVVDWFVDLNK